MVEVEWYSDHSRMIFSLSFRTRYSFNDGISRTMTWSKLPMYNWIHLNSFPFWIKALSLFRLLSILAGVQARSRLGNASSASAAAVAADSVLLGLAEVWLKWPDMQVRKCQSCQALGFCHPHTFSGKSILLFHPKAALEIISRSQHPTQKASPSFLPDNDCEAAGCGGFIVEGLNPKVSASMWRALPRPKISAEHLSCKCCHYRRHPFYFMCIHQVRDLRSRLISFMTKHVIPSEETFEAHAVGPDRWTVHPRMEQLKNMVGDPTRLHNIYKSIYILDRALICHDLLTTYNGFRQRSLCVCQLGQIWGPLEHVAPLPPVCWSCAPCRGLWWAWESHSTWSRP